MKSRPAAILGLALAAVLVASSVLAQVARPGQFSWNYTDYEPAGTLRTLNVEWWLSEMEKRSNGAIAVTLTLSSDTA